METPFASEEEPIETEHAQGSGGDKAGLLSGRTLIGALVAAALGAFLLISIFSGGAADDPVAGEEQEFATLAFLTAEGETSTLADFQGDALVVNFFASWCAPCRAELPDFEAAHLANADAVRFVGINHDFEEQTWRSFVEETEISFETVFQPNTEIWNSMDAKGTPATAFISADGQLQYLYTGVLSEELLQELIDEHLTGKA